MRSSAAPRNRPFWIAGSSYYFLSAALALALFFLVWGVLLETGEASPFIAAGISASLFLIVAFVIREVLIKRARLKRIAAQRQLDLNLDSITKVPIKPRAKLSLGQNANLLNHILAKSEAARVLVHVPDAHWEVFELCESYLAMTRKEIARTHVNSPRFGPINRGRGKIKKLHKHHLLKWAKERAGILSLDVTNGDRSFVSKIDQAELAQDCLRTALEYYPREKKLQESHEAIKEYVSTIKISHKMEQAHRAASRGENNRAVRLYRDALFALAREGLREREKTVIAEKINLEIRKLRGG